MFETLLVNRSNFRKAILDYGGKMIFTLAPGEERPLPDGTHYENPFERFEKIIFNQDGNTTVVQNSKWRPPEGEGWATEFINNGPNESEKIQVGGEWQTFFRFIPRMVLVPISDPFVFFSEVKFVPEKILINHWADPGKVFEITNSQIKRTLRCKKELDKILAELEEAAARPAKSAAEKRLGLATGKISIKDLSGISVEKT